MKNFEKLVMNTKTDILFNNNCVELPNDLLKEIISGKVVIFAGAGISTERKYCFNTSFYEDICYSLNINPKACKLSFAKLMSKFVDITGSKNELLNQILYRIEYAKNFPEIKRKVTEFHRLLRHIPYIQDIVTTNWDNFFEEYTNALPIIQDKDFVFANYNSKRKVYKIHGSISTPSSIVATKNDYDECYKNLNSGLLGSSLKLILATKTIIFVGFSFGDEDLDKIFNFIETTMTDFLPKVYIVNPFETTNKKRYKKATIIKSDACDFLQEIIKELHLKKYLFNTPDVYNKIENYLNKNKKIHFKTAELFQNNKELKHRIMHSLVFQDGISHALERGLANIYSGKYLQEEYLIKSLYAYRKLCDDLLLEKRYFDFSYAEGYIAGLSMFLSSKNESYFYIPGYGKQIKNFNLYVKEIQKPLNKKFERYSLKYFNKIIIEAPEHIIHHPPFIY